MAASIARCLKGLYAVFWLCALPVSGFLNLEELSEMKYGIQILPDPVIKGQARSEDVMLVSSKYRQLYECRLPPQALRFQRDTPPEPDPQGYSGPGIAELLRPMDGAPCLVKTKDWWTYEFCFGKHVRQYHLEDSEIKGDVLYLGHYSTEFDWNNETAKASKRHRLKRYHSQTYVNGSKCDLNGEPRETEVRFQCEEGSGDYIARVDEPQSCSYVLTVHTMRTCHHPFLRPPSANKPLPITCQPALTPEQYMEYVRAQVSDTKRKVQQISEELKNLDEILSKDEGAEGQNGGVEEDFNTEDVDFRLQGDNPPAEEDSIEDLEDADFWDGVTKPERNRVEEEVLAEGEGEADVDGPDAQFVDDFEEEGIGDEKFNFKIITDSSDLMKFINHLQESNRKAVSEKDSVREEAVGQTRGLEEVGEEEEEEEEDDEQLLQEFEEEMADLSVPSSKIGEIKEEMQKEFDNIIDEAQQELETEGLKGEFDRREATKTLGTTLEKLLDRLEDREVQERGAGEGVGDSADHARGSPSLAPRQPEEAADDQVKIRVTKYKPGGSPETQLKVQEMREGDPQMQQIKDVVKEQLEKAGLKAEGKIEVKILTRKNIEEDGDQWLTEEDTKSFRELLINLLTGGTEEVYKEQKRQQELENNYRFVWGEKQDETQSTGTTDSDDLDF
ncbi:protein OS-9 isoform X2 [Amia ocellicauda]|uniref:protein OS-9 isoform X2 n=1 Tax=Amia ocellicauda TaxID=2972642 RepID=UPI003464B233